MKKAQKLSLKFYYFSFILPLIIKKNMVNQYMALNTTHRTNESEIMDDFQLEGDELRDALDKIAKINQLLGGNKLTLLGVKELIADNPKTAEITIVDVGCGNGDMLRTLADYGLQHNIKFNLIGVDANNFTVNHAINLSKMYPNIIFVKIYLISL
jgi:2-polyprenyl-3-methyl-5-hydroxy-6-metoxy-1,4-benzoquinol methylase